MTLSLIVALAAAAAFLFLVNQFSVVVTPQNDSDVTVEYGSGYQDAGAKAYFVGTLVLKSGYELEEIQVQNNVNADVLGDYCVTYSAECLWFTGSATRNVHVVDTEKPVIELVSSPDTFTFPGETYEEEGYSASDNYDGDLTDKVFREEKDGVVTYTVSDSSGNETTVQREIFYDDPVAPELTLQGEKEITITAGNSYQEPGYTASDNVDGDLTDKVEVTGEVNIYSAGTYTLQYKVVDGYGNEATASRTVIVKPVVVDPLPEIPSPPIAPTGKVIYLTFDDGPGPYTGELLDVLAKYNVKATFFVVNTGYYDTMRRIVNEGHSIAIHTATHSYSKIYASEDAYFEDLYTMRNIIKEQTGVDTTLVRFPGGSSNSVSAKYNKGIMTRLTKALGDLGFQYFDWNVDSRDAGGASTAEEVYRNVANGCSRYNNSIVLQHDIRGYSVKAVEDIIIWGIANGYTFLPLGPNSPTAHHGLTN